MKKLIYLIICLAMAASCGRGAGRFTASDLKIIHNDGCDSLPILTINSYKDSIFLRQPCKDLSVKEIHSKAFETLARKMIYTVQLPSVNGVGLAGPQIGLSYRVVALMRYDKAGHPFEVYPNVRILQLNEPWELGAEGCLSVLGRKENVFRSRNIVVEYYDIKSKSMIRETITGYTAVIFQHETDHLDGILYTDCLMKQN